MTGRSYKHVNYFNPHSSIISVSGERYSACQAWKCIFHILTFHLILIFTHMYAVTHTAKGSGLDIRQSHINLISHTVVYTGMIKSVESFQHTAPNWHLANAFLCFLGNSVLLPQNKELSKDKVSRLHQRVSFFDLCQTFHTRQMRDDGKGDRPHFNSRDYFISRHVRIPCKFIP